MTTTTRTWLVTIAVSVAAVWSSVSLAHAQAQPSAPVTDAPWARYDRAFAVLAEGKRDQARLLLLALLRDAPDHPAGRLARQRLMELQPPRDTPSDIKIEGISRQARAELLLWMTINGVLLADNVCEVAECDGNRAWAASLMTSAAVGLGGSFLASRGGVTQGQVQLYNSSMTWGSWNALGINDGFSGSSSEAQIAIAAQFAGLGLGLGLWKTWRPQEGDVALANTVGLWSTVLFSLGHAWVDDDSMSLQRAVIAGDVGIAAGALLSTKIKMSRGRTLLIDVGGVLGLLAGGLVAVGSGDEKTALGALFIGAGFGVGVAAVATSDWDAPKPVTRVANKLRLIPTRLPNKGWGAAIGFEL